MAKKIDIDTKTFIRFWLVIFGIGLFVTFISRAKTGLVLILLAMFLAVALNPLAKRLDRIDKSHERSALSSVLAVVLVVVSVLAVLAIVGPIVVNEVVRFASQASANIEQMTSAININSLGEAFGIENLSGQVVTAVKDFSSGIVSNLGGFAMNSISAIGSFMTSATLVVVLTVLFMLQGPDLLRDLWNTVEKHRGKKAVEVWSRVVSRIARVISVYLSRQALVAMLDGAATMVIVFVVALIFPEVSMSLVVPLGLLAMAMYMIPMFGPVISCIVAVLLLGFNSVFGAVVYLALYLFYAQIESNVLAPKIQGKGMGLSPLVILISITIGMYAFGIIGTFVAIPVAGCIKVLLEEYQNIKSLNE
jgi:predicted PurR-regulated permease PerM